VKEVCERLGVSQRRACRVLAQPRSTQRHRPCDKADEERLTGRIIELATAYGRYGYRRITALLRREGWRVNHKRVERIWRREGLKVPKRQPKRRRLWLNDGSCIATSHSHSSRKLGLNIQLPSWWSVLLGLTQVWSMVCERCCRW
jgi:transposase InsO family protein